MKRKTDSCKSPPSFLKTLVSVSSVTIVGNLADTETFLLSAAQKNELTLSCS